MKFLEPLMKLPTAASCGTPNAQHEKDVIASKGVATRNVMTFPLKHVLLIVLGFGLLIAGLKFEFSQWPMIFWCVASLVFIGYSWKNSFWTALGYVVIALLAAQVVSPLFIPKISVSDMNVTFEIIGSCAGGRNSKLVGQFEVKVRPPLFPIVRSISIPAHNVGDCHISPNRASDAHKAAMNSRLFSYDFTNSNEIKFNISTDANGWTYDELKTKIEYCADSDVPPMFKIDDHVNINQSTLTAPVHFQNDENIPLYLCTDLKNVEVNAAGMQDGEYCIDWCDNPPQSNFNCSTPIAGCSPFSNISIDGGKTFTTEKLIYHLNSTSSFRINAPINGEAKATIGYVVVRPAQCNESDMYFTEYGVEFVKLLDRLNISRPFKSCCYKEQKQECERIQKIVS